MTGKKSDSCTPGANAFACGLPAPLIDGLPNSIQPLMQFGMTLHGDWLELCGHRVSAWLEWPANLCTCKTVDEVRAAQIEYLETMGKHYADYLDGVLRGTMMIQDGFEEESKDDAPERHFPELDREAA